MKKTIVYYGNFYLPDRNAAAHRVVSIGKILRDLGYHVVFLGVSYDTERFSGIRSVKNAYGFDMYEIACPQGTSEWIRWMFRIEQLLDLLTRYPDTEAVFLYNSPYSIVSRVAKAVHKKGIRLVYDITEWCAVTEGSFAKIAMKKLDARLIRSSVQKKADGLIVISALMQRHYAHHKKPLIRLSPLVDLSDPIWHETPQPSTYPVSFCFAGTVDADKDSLDMIVESFAAITDSRVGLDVIGVTKEEFCASYPAMQIPPRVTFHGRLSHTETVRHILGSDFYIIARKSDLRNNAGFSTKFTEAATCGIPLLTTVVSDFGEYLGKTVPGYAIPTLTVGDISRTIMRAVDEKNDAPKQRSDVFDYRTHIGAVQGWLAMMTSSGDKEN